MSNGLNSIVINTAERAISTDINRLQSFQTKGLMEAMRYLMNVVYAGSTVPGGADDETLNNADDCGAASVGVESVTTGSPLQAEVLGGLCVIPQVGTLALGVTPGMLFCIFPDPVPSTDDSPYKYVQDPGGLPQCQGLVMTAGAVSGRIDVIECQPIANPSPEEDNRDIFNPVTGLFTASTVQKTAGDVLQYRVRQGTPGLGYPGTVQGWLPLCIALVPSSATTCDSMTFWDVRPLVSDRIFSPFNIATDLPRRKKLLYSTYNGSSGTANAMNGIVEVDFGNTRAGGRIQLGAPGVDFNDPSVDFALAQNHEQGLTLSGPTALLFYYLAFPYGLPRWSRYTDSNDPRGRVPRSPRGLPIASKSPPSHVYGVNTSPIVPSNLYGFNNVPFDVGTAVCFGATTYGGGFIFTQVTADGFTDLALPMAQVFGNNTAGSSPFFDGNFVLTENTHFPAGATRIQGTITMPVEYQTGTNTIFDIFGQLTAQVSSDPYQFSTTNLDNKVIAIGSANRVGSLVWNFEISLPNYFPNQNPDGSSPPGATYDLFFTFGSSTSFPSNFLNGGNATLVITGWQYGD